VGDAIGQVLSFGVGVALSPIPIIGVVLILGTPDARANGLAFIAGWVIGLAVAGGIVLLLASGAGASNSGTPADWLDVVKLALGVLLGVLTVRSRCSWLGTVGPAIPVAIYFLMRERAAAILGGMRDWMARENTTIMAVLCAVIGAKLVGDAISGLAS
jgi:hypothetical protein